LTSDDGQFIFILDDIVRKKIIEELESKHVREKLKPSQKISDISNEEMDSLLELYKTNSDYIYDLNQQDARGLILALINSLEPVQEKSEIVNDNIYSNSYAVIIGINEYTKSKPLKYAVNDALAINDMLINKFGFKNKNIRLLTDKEATYSKIRKNLFDIAKLAEENDRILVYFAGHGQTVSTQIDKMEIGYLIPVDTDVEKPEEEGIPMDDFVRMGRMSKSKHILFLMDACYSGLMAEAPRGIDKDRKEQGYLSTVSNISARQIITAGGAKQEVVEIDELQHSAFTYNLLNALDKWEAGSSDKGYITASMLGEYLRTTVSNDTRGKQTPEVARFRYSKSGEFIFYRSP
jgi:uncharacterized caspase-like protein